MQSKNKEKHKNLLINFLRKTKTKDPIQLLMVKIFKQHFLLAALTMGLLTVGTWIGISYLIERYYPGQANVYFYDKDEFTFGLFLWGFFIPVMWWYYLSSPSAWKKTIESLQKKGLVDPELIHIIPENSFTVLAALLAAMVGLLYRFNSIPTEISLGRISFWFTTDWSIILICTIVSVNAYVLINFLLDTILLSYRMAVFFKRKGIRLLVIFHIDGCGGFGLIGQMAMRMSSLAVLAGLWAVWYSYLPKFFGVQPNLGLNVWLIYGVYIILAPLLLLSLTWPVHKAMKKYKLDYKERVCNNLESTFNNLSNFNILLNSVVETPCNDPKAINENLDMYKRLIQVLDRVDAIPTWPILLSNFKKFTGFASLPGIIGFVSFLFDVIDFSELLK